MRPGLSIVPPLRCGSVIEVDFPSAFRPRYTILRLGDRVLLQSEHGRECTMTMDTLRAYVRAGTCVVLEPAQAVA